MVDQNIPQYVALLRQQYLFQGLDDAEIAQIATRFEPVEYKPGEVVFAEGDEGHHFYVVYTGSVQVSQQVKRRERTQRFLKPPSFFGERALLFDEPRTVTVTADTPTVLLRLDRDAFQELMDSFPEIRRNLSATGESRYLLHKESFDWLGEDEVVYLIARKHPFFLMTSLILPALMAVGSIPLIAFSLTAPTQFTFTGGLIAGILLLLLGIGLGVWNAVDWGNDYYIVTDQRVIWLERVIGIYSSRREALLTQVLSVNVTRSFLGRHLGYGDVEVRTFTGGTLLRNMSHPKQFEEFVRGYQQRAQQLSKQNEKLAIDQTIRDRLGMPPLETPQSPNFPRPHRTKRTAHPRAKPGSWRHRLETFLRVRYEQSGVITYRKHLLLLMAKEFLPTLLGLLIVIGSAYLIIQGFETLAILIIEGFLIVLVSLWWLYQYLDWSNDIYQLTPDQILDIELKPLGQENKKSAPLESILSIEHTRKGLIQLIFNYGTVIINVGQTEFDFRGVTNPDQVHQDVADYTEARRRRKLEAEAARERERMADWLAAYRRQTESLEETDHPDWDIFPRFPG